ncbi:MAG TPA: response regulator [Polyangiales bacterium]
MHSVSKRPTAPSEVLVIDDSDLARDSIKRMLEAAGFSVVTAPSAIGASAMILHERVRVVVVDLHMPAMLGSSLVGVLRKHPRLRELAIVLISGAPVDQLVTAAGAAGANAAISKLEMASTLVPAVRRLLRRPKAAYL